MPTKKKNGLNQIIREDNVNRNYIPEAFWEAVKNVQKVAKINVASEAYKSLAANKGFVVNLKLFLEDLKQFHYDWQNNTEPVEDIVAESLQHTDDYLSKRRAVKKDGKIELPFDAHNVVEDGLCEKIDNFLFELDELGNYKPNSKDGEKKYKDVFSSQSKDGFIDIMEIIKKMQADEMVPENLRKKCATVLKSFDKIIDKAFEGLQPNTETTYVARNTGVFNVGTGEQLMDGIAKTTAVYEWKRKKVQLGENATEFNKEQMDADAKALKENPIFKTFYYNEVNGKLSPKTGEMNTSGKRCKEWRVNNKIERPFYYAEKNKMIDSLTKLQELGDAIPEHQDGASEDYHRFNFMLKDLGDRNFAEMTPESMGTLLNDIYTETERYMKGRKSERYKNVSKEHFEEALDVLAVLSAHNEYGEALAKKLVDRTNEVRTHRWHHLSSQPTVTLEGRGIEATRARLEDLNAGRNVQHRPVIKEKASAVKGK